MLFSITFFSYTAKPEVKIEAESLLKAIYEYLKRPGASLYGASLYGASLCGVDLYGADLRGADLRGASDMKYLKGLNFDTWQIGYTAKELQIGCQRHEISKWLKWNSPAGRKWIASMDGGALQWADKYMDLVLRIVELAPAEDTGFVAKEGEEA